MANGADICNAARAFMFSLGCIQALKCNSNKCPTGITTQDPALNAGVNVDNKQIRVSNFHAATVLAATEIVAAMGLTDPSKVGGEHLWKRENGIHIANYTDMHESYLPEMYGGELVEEGMKNVPGKMYSKWWREGEELCDKMG